MNSPFRIHLLLLAALLCVGLPINGIGQTAVKDNGPSGVAIEPAPEELAWLQAHPAAAPPLELSDEEIAWLADHPVIQVAVDPNWAPVEFIDEHGDLQGVSADYLERLESLLGVRFEAAQDITWSEGLRRVRDGKLDMLASVNRTPERADDLAFTKPYLSMPIAIFTGPAVTYIGSLDELEGRKVAGATGPGPPGYRVGGRRRPGRRPAPAFPG